MSTPIEIRLPDIGDFTGVPVIEVHVAPGDQVAVDDPILTLESDKATMDIPAPQAGTVRELRVGVGDEVSQGDLLLTLEAAGAEGGAAREHVTEEATPATSEPAGYGSPAGVYDRLEVRVPDIGEYENVPVIEVHVAPGDTISAEDPLLTLESDKATMDVPAPVAGTVAGVRVGVGDTVSEGDVIVELQTGQAVDSREQPPSESVQATPAPTPAPAEGAEADVQAEVLVLGAGPGGYSAAFRAADLGKSVVLVDSSPILGGVCLNVGCIPSKALLHAARVIAETKEMAEHGLAFGEPAVDLDKLRDWKESVVRRLTNGLAGLAKQRKVKVVTGDGTFASPNHLEVTGDGPDGGRVRAGDHRLRLGAGDPAVHPPRRRAGDRLHRRPGAGRRARAAAGHRRRHHRPGDGDRLPRAGREGDHRRAARPAHPRRRQGPGHPAVQADLQAATSIYLKTKVTKVDAEAGRPGGPLRGRQGARHRHFDRSWSRSAADPTASDRGRACRRRSVDERGFIEVDKQQRTNVPHIFAIGDVVGQPMLAHKAVHEGHVAAEAAAGKTSSSTPRYPLGRLHRPRGRLGRVTENEAKAKGVKYGKGCSPGRLAAGPWPSAATRARPSCCSTRPRTGSSAAARRPQRRRADRRGAAGDRDGRRRHRHRPHRPPPPHPVRDRRHGRRDFEGTITDLYLPKRRR